MSPMTARTGRPPVIVLVGVAYLVVATAWVSYLHLLAVIRAAGTTGASAYLLAGVPDALAAVGGAYALRGGHGRALAWAAVALGVLASLGGNVAAVLAVLDADSPTPVVVRAVAVAVLAPLALALTLWLVEHHHGRQRVVDAGVSEGEAVSDGAPPVSVSPSGLFASGAGFAPLAPAPEVSVEPKRSRSAAAVVDRPVVRVVASTRSSRRDEIRAWHATNPDATQAEIAGQFHVSTKTVQRALADPEPALNGSHRGDNR